jgi:hypothetical protein
MWLYRRLAGRAGVLERRVGFSSGVENDCVDDQESPEKSFGYHFSFDSLWWTYTIIQNNTFVHK